MGETCERGRLDRRKLVRPRILGCVVVSDSIMVVGVVVVVVVVVVLVLLVLVVFLAAERSPERGSGGAGVVRGGSSLRRDRVNWFVPGNSLLERRRRRVAPQRI